MQNGNQRPRTERVLITGAAGKIGRKVVEGLRGRYSLLRLSDIVPVSTEGPREDAEVADLTDAAQAEAVTRGMDCIVHLAGVPVEDTWERILPNNIVAAFNVFEAARRNGVRRVVFASSNHVIGYYRSDREVDADVPPRPDSRYGVSKVFGEALGRLYADKHGLEVVCLRVGSFREQPENARQLATWASPRDTVELVRCAIEAQPVTFLVVYGVSRNDRCKWHDAAEAKLGYVAEDNAETFAAQLEPSKGDTLADMFHGGGYCELEFSGDSTRID